MTESVLTIWNPKTVVRIPGGCDLRSSAGKSNFLHGVKPRGRPWRRTGTVSATIPAFIRLFAILLALPTLLHSLPANARSIMSTEGWTDLRHAAHGGHREAVEELISAGAELNTRRVMSTAGWTDLHHAAYGGHREAVEELISTGAELNARSAFGRTPLHAAVLGNEPGVAELLLAAGADVDAKGNDGETPLHVAANWNAERVVDELIAGGADVEARDNSVDGAAPYDKIGCSRGRIEVDCGRRQC